MYTTKMRCRPFNPQVAITPLLLTLFFLIISFTFSQAQQKPTVIIAEFTHNPQTVQKIDADKIHGMIAQYFSSTSRFIMINRDKWKAIMAEKETQKSMDFIDGYMVEQGNAMGADVMVFGHVIETGDNINFAAVQLVGIDVATSKEVFNQILLPSGRSTGGAIETTEVIDASDDLVSKGEGTSDGAATMKNIATLGETMGLSVNNLMRKSLEKNTVDLINEYYPLKLLISQFVAKGNKVNEVKLYGTKQYGFKKGQKYKVVASSIIETPEGPGTLEETVAEIRVTEIQGDFASCKVLSGHKELFAKQEADNIYVKVANSNLNLPFGR
ncbi:MAG: hypothetical protein AAGI23_08065 [Bacteroidota bacterium]